MSIKEQLLGTSWSLVSYKSQDRNGKLLYPLGKNAKGVIIFTAEKRTAVQIMKSNGENKISEDTLASYNTEGEKEMARLGYHAYSGPFTIDEEVGTLTTHVDLSLLESYVGSDQVRAVRIEGDLLYLSNVQYPERQLVWERIKD